MRIELGKRISVHDLHSPVEKFASPFPYTFRMEDTIESVLHTLQSKKGSQDIEVFYVTDEENVLRGAITVHDLLYNPSYTRLIDILDPDIPKVGHQDRLEKGLKEMKQHQTLALPVVDPSNRLVGVLEVHPHDPETVAKMKRHERKSVKEDIFQFIGFTIEQGKWQSSWVEFRYRMPWLGCNLIGGLICAVIGELYQFTLAEFVILALFIPLVLSLSESISIQSMTLSLRFLHFRKIHWLQIWRRLFVEWKTSLLLALTCILIISAFYFAISLEFKPILAISLSMLISMVFAATFGALFPILLHLLKLDPKVAAGPLILMMADVVTISIYLSISTWLLI